MFRRVATKMKELELFNEINQKARSMANYYFFFLDLL